jgi:hypothetical protein
MSKISISVFCAVLMASPASAATFGVFEGENNYECILSLGGLDEMTIKAMQGGGEIGPVTIEFFSSELMNAYPYETELRLEIRNEGSTFPRTVLIGEMWDFESAPGFVAPLSLIADIGEVEQFTYKLHSRPAVEINSITQAQAEQFVACMVREEQDATHITQPPSNTSPHKWTLMTATEVIEITRYANHQCRGGLGDEREPLAWCGVREALVDILELRGYCYGQWGQGGTEMDWHQCGPGSEHRQIPPHILDVVP